MNRTAELWHVWARPSPPEAGRDIRQVPGVARIGVAECAQTSHNRGPSHFLPAHSEHIWMKSPRRTAPKSPARRPTTARKKPAPAKSRRPLLIIDGDSF